MLTWDDIEARAVAFSKRWKNNSGIERQAAQTFEKDFMYVFGVDWREGVHEYLIKDLEGKDGYIDYLLPGKILIEMKSRGESLIKAYNQAIKYYRSLKPEEQPEFIMVSDFNEIRAYNIKNGIGYSPFKISQLKQHARIFDSLAGFNSKNQFHVDIEVNTKASYKLANLHDALKEKGYQGHQLEVYLVRLLFCLFAEDTGIFEDKTFESYIKTSKEDGSELSAHLMILFNILNTPEENRMKTTPEVLMKFRYINGRLFEESLPPAWFDGKMRQLLIDCCEFDWSKIIPSIFGAMFQGVMNPKERRTLGAHYTSEENILKVIKPLFLDNLWIELHKAKNTKKELKEFHKKISQLKFLDPACGCGNFLIIAYRELRNIEFEILKYLDGHGQLKFLDSMESHVSIEQFCGIEIEDFPCQVAQVGLLLMKHQMDTIISNHFGLNVIDFPIREMGHILNANALRCDWFEVFPGVDYIMGNPPFVGASNQSKNQKTDMIALFKDKNSKDYKSIGNMDYVCAWFYMASKLIYEHPEVSAAFVATNSICQGESVSILWRPLIENYNIGISFAYKTFCWSNEAKGKAAVHCVIIGLSENKIEKKIIYEKYNKKTVVENINPYIIDACNIFVSGRSESLCSAPSINYGNMAIDGGNLILSEEEKDALIKDYPECSPYIRLFLGSYEFINNKKRYCLWLVDCPAKLISFVPEIKKRIEAVRSFRLRRLRSKTLEAADIPYLFTEIRHCDGDYLLIPKTSSSGRKYIPIGFEPPDVIASDAVFIVPDATQFHFGVLTSSIHMIWLKYVGGRLKSDYRYSSSLVYNTFPWPNPNLKQKREIESYARLVLEARDKHSDISLGEMYNPLTMPPDILRAHIKLDKAVGKAYGRSFNDEQEVILHLFSLYKELNSNC